jgi:hypothetical protein
MFLKGIVARLDARTCLSAGFQSSLDHPGPDSVQSEGISRPRSPALVFDIVTVRSTGKLTGVLLAPSIDR